MQVSDCHLRDRSNGGLAWCPECEDFDTLNSLKQVVNDLTSNLHKPHAIMATGDIAQDPTPGAYRQFHDVMDRLKIPVYCMAGNHDDVDMMKRYGLGQNITMPGYLISSNWLVVFMRSYVKGQGYGLIDQSELDRLSQLLKQNPKRHVLVLTHHHPLTIDCPWIDRLRLINGEWFMERLAEIPQVRGVAFGHIHQQFNESYDNILLMGTPSTCIQFKPHSKAFELDELTPGYRRITLLSDGEIETEVQFITARNLRLIA